MNRRDLVLLLPSGTLAWQTWPGAAAAAAPQVLEANIQLDLAPNQALYNAADPELRGAAALLQKVRPEKSDFDFCVFLLDSDFRGMSDYRLDCGLQALNAETVQVR